MKVLLINAHPEPHNQQAYAVQMANHFAALIPADQLDILNLYEADIPPLDGAMLELFRKQAAQAELSTEEQALAGRMAAVLRQFKSAKRIVIAMPLHNFNIPARLKDYIDNVMIAR
ncbi:NAD(P)H-dependent oxidoreductase [Rodentibacter trehalosifermentans]|uniref:NAD(P)H-dependent oxidoreductase n=1 Tax=Rodentibacter trehalosifermentans TaxID=1908263 RepID=UPI001A96A211|nr:NAD(P)H-dependent oxidoreductase [Rodentibacter trehalosifermentans]